MNQHEEKTEKLKEKQIKKKKSECNQSTAAGSNVVEEATEREGQYVSYLRKLGQSDQRFSVSLRFIVHVLGYRSTYKMWSMNLHFSFSAFFSPFLSILSCFLTCLFPVVILELFIVCSCLSCSLLVFSNSVLLCRLPCLAFLSDPLFSFFTLSFRLGIPCLRHFYISLSSFCRVSLRLCFFPVFQFCLCFLLFLLGVLVCPCFPHSLSCSPCHLFILAVMPWRVAV